MSKEGNFQYVPKFAPEFNPIKNRKKLEPPQWESFDRHAKETEIRKLAERDADSDIPSGEDWSDTENKIRADANMYQKKLEEIGEKYFDELDRIIDSYRHFLLDLDNFETFYNNLTTNARNCIDRAKLELSKLQRVHKENVEHYERFKKLHQLKRMPFLISKWKAFGIVFTLFVIEIFINNLFVADYLEGGGLEAIALTAGIAFLNVFISLGIGYYFLKNIVHIDIHRRIIGALVLVLHIALFFYINWMYSAFRTQKVMEFEEGVDVASTNVSVWLPWTVNIQFESLILLIIGFVFSVASLLDGYFFDDPYPGYGKTAHIYNKSKKDIEAELDRLVSTMQEIFMGVLKESDKMRATLTLAVNHWSEETNSFQKEFASYEKKILNVEKDINYLLEQYIIANKQRRERIKSKYPLPKRFEEIRTFSYQDNQKNPHEVFKAQKHIYREDAERIKERKELQSDVNKKSNIFTIQIEEFKEEMLTTVKEMQKEYEPA